MRKNEIIAFDMDNTLTEFYDFSSYLDHTPRYWMRVYEELKPNKVMIAKLNKLAKDNLVYIFTARDDVYEAITIKWLKKHGVKAEYTLMKKPFYNLFVDDRAMSVEQFMEEDLE